MDADAREIKRIDHQKLTRLVARAFERLAVPENDADVAAKILVAADLRGVDTHGVIRFTPSAWYVKWLTEGSMTARPDVRVISESPSTALVDGDRGMGMVVGHRVMEIAIGKARQSGIGMVGVRNSRHYGMSAYYAMMGLPHDMIGIAMTVGGLQVPPTFGAKPMVGLNPLAIAVPARNEAPFVFDASMSATAGLSRKSSVPSLNASPNTPMRSTRRSITASTARRRCCSLLGSAASSSGNFRSRRFAR